METILTILEIERKMSVINIHCHLKHMNTDNGSWWVSIDDIYIYNGDRRGLLLSRTPQS